MQREDNHRQDRQTTPPPPLRPQKHPKAAWCAVDAPRRKAPAAQSLEDGEGRPPAAEAAAAAAEKSAAEGAWAAEGGAGEATTPLKLPALNLHPVVADLTAAGTPRERRDSAAAA